MYAYIIPKVQELSDKQGTKKNPHQNLLVLLEKYTQKNKLYPKCMDFSCGVFKSPAQLRLDDNPLKDSRGHVGHQRA